MGPSAPDVSQQGCAEGKDHPLQLAGDAFSNVPLLLENGNGLPHPVLVEVRLSPPVNDGQTTICQLRKMTGWWSSCFCADSLCVGYCSYCCMWFVYTVISH